MIIEYLRKITEIISSIIYIIETQQEEIDKQKKEIECLHKELKALKAHRNIIYTYSPCPYPCSRPLSLDMIKSHAVFKMIKKQKAQEQLSQRHCKYCSNKQNYDGEDRCARYHDSLCKNVYRFCNGHFFTYQ